MLFPLFPRLEDFELEANLAKENSSSFWDSSDVEERELESPDVGLVLSFLDAVNLDLHLDFPFSGGATGGAVRLFVNDSGSRETDDTDCNRDWFPREYSGKLGVSTASGEILGGLSLFSLVSMHRPSLDVKPSSRFSI